jgi:ABC-type polysaccharide/polyol phosphate transport system ATPase subunit
MRDARIEFHGVWKKFQRGQLHDSLRDLIPAMARRMMGRAPERDQLSRGEFWAVRDVSFTVQPGEALGIIGPNGAGKSTILKLLTQILTPTRGHCMITGRAGALIEVAAGFHPDLTGRENVYLQGAIMGMRRAEITRRFDEIVTFAELEQFIDTPVKRYSSGMNARLGFAIAAHIDPDVLVIDEVLAVGDLRFQQKAFDRIRAMCTSGIPVALVSHQLERVATLCTHALLLDRGRVVRRGTPSECIEAYLGNEAASEPQEQAAAATTIHSIALASRAPVRSGDRARFRITGVTSSAFDGPRVCSIRVRSLTTGTRVFAVETDQCGITLPDDGPFTMEVELQFNVPPDVYSVETSVWSNARQRDVARGPALTLQVELGPVFTGTVQMLPRMHLLASDRVSVHAGS